jgi:hypothetical protein
MAKLEQQRRAKSLSASHTGFAVTGAAGTRLTKPDISWRRRQARPLELYSHSPKKSPYTLPCAATKMCHATRIWLLLLLEDFTVVLSDCAALSIVRRLEAGQGSPHGADQ